MQKTTTNNITQFLIPLLEQSLTSTTTADHKIIYNKIHEIQENPLTYISLIEIASNMHQKYHINIRKMALIVLKTAMQRNSDILEFGGEEMLYLIQATLNLSLQISQQVQQVQVQVQRVQVRMLNKSVRSLISLLITWKKNINFDILTHILSIINNCNNNNTKCYDYLDTIKMVFEDIRFQTENYQNLNTQQFMNFVTNFIQIFANKIQQNNIEICTICLKCMNLIIRHLPATSQIVCNYLVYYLQPLLVAKGVSGQIRVQLLQGLIQILEVNSGLILNDGNVLGLIVHYALQDNMTNNSNNMTNNITNSNNRVLEQQIKKQWLSLILDIITTDNQTQQKLSCHIPILITKLVTCLTMLRQDQDIFYESMQEQMNPYQYDNNDNNNNNNQQQEQQEDDDNFICNGQDNWRYTPRKLAMLCLQRLVTNYMEECWLEVERVLAGMVGSQDWHQQEIGATLIGLVYENMEEHLQHFPALLNYLLTIITHNSIPHTKTHTQILKCSCLCSISKTAYLITRQPQLQNQTLQSLLLCLHQTPHSNIHSNIYICLDQLLSNTNNQQAYLSQQIFTCLQTGLPTNNNKSLYSILKVYVTLFDKHADMIPDTTVQQIIGQLCKKWGANSGKQSVVCPIVQCLVTICGNKGVCFSRYAVDIMKQSLNIIVGSYNSGNNQKQLVIRVIDLLSAIIVLRVPDIVSYVGYDGGFHQIVCKMLLQSVQREIVNFAYGLIGDICRCTPIAQQYAENYIKVIGNQLYNKQQTNNKSSQVTSTLTSASNSLTCLTDLLTSHKELALQDNAAYSKIIIKLAIKKLSINNLNKIYAFNFARIYGRMGNIVPQCGVQYIGSSLVNVCIGLRASQYSYLTDMAFGGLFKIVAINPEAVVQKFQYLVDSFICYPCSQEAVKEMFVYLLKSFKSSRNQMQWEYFLKKPIFLPAVVKRIEAMCNN